MKNSTNPSNKKNNKNRRWRKTKQNINPNVKYNIWNDNENDCFLHGQMNYCIIIRLKDILFFTKKLLIYIHYSPTKINDCKITKNKIYIIIIIIIYT